MRRKNPGEMTLKELAEYLNEDFFGYDFAWLIPDYLEDRGASEEQVEEARDQPYQFYDEMPEDQIKKFDEWAQRYVDRHIIGDITLVPSYRLFADAKVRKTSRIIRFVEDPWDSVYDGLVGWDSVDPLAYTGMWGTVYGQSRVKEGWCFGFSIDVGRGEREARAAARTGKYGRYALVLTAPHVTAYHFGDEEEQAIFRCNKAKIHGYVDCGPYGDFDSWKLKGKRSRKPYFPDEPDATSTNFMEAVNEVY